MFSNLSKPATIVLSSVLALAAVAAAIGQSDPTPTFPENPWADKSDAERQADVDAAHKRNDEYLLAFVASKQDPRSLPTLEIPQFAAPLGDLLTAAAAADLILRGVVEETTFQINASGGLPVSSSTVRIAAQIKGNADGDTITVTQLGGPVAQSEGGAFAHLTGAEPILPGDDVLLLLQRDPDGRYAAQSGTGVYYIRDGKTQPQKSNPFGAQMSGLNVAEATTLIRSAIAGSS